MKSSAFSVLIITVLCIGVYPRYPWGVGPPYKEALHRFLPEKSHVRPIAPRQRDVGDIVSYDQRQRRMRPREPDDNELSELISNRVVQYSGDGSTVPVPDSQIRHREEPVGQSSPSDSSVDSYQD